MRPNDKGVTRATSAVAGILTLVGGLGVLVGLVLFVSPTGGMFVGGGALVGGLFLIGLGSLRSGLLDVVYELRLLRASVADQTSNQAATRDEAGR